MDCPPASLPPQTSTTELSTESPDIGQPKRRPPRKTIVLGDERYDAFVVARGESVIGGRYTLDQAIDQMYAAGETTQRVVAMVGYVHDREHDRVPAPPVGWFDS